MYFFVYGKGNPFIVLLVLGFPSVADLVATTLCDSTSRWLVFVPSWVKDAADHYVYLRGYNHHCCRRCFKLLWRPHTFENYHDECYQLELVEEVEDARICGDHADDVLFRLEMEDLDNEVVIATMSDASFDEWLEDRFPNLDKNIRSLAVAKFRARELG